MAVTTVNPQITKVAEQYFEENRDEFIASLAQRVQQGMAQAEEDKAQGKFMDLATFKKKLYALDLTK